MVGIYIAAAALMCTILGATWKLSTLISALKTSIEGLTKTVDRQTDKLERHNEFIVRHDEQIRDMRDRMDSAA